MKLMVVEAKRLDELTCHLPLDRAAVWHRADRDLLEPWGALEYLARSAEPELVGDHARCDHGLAQPPARLDHSFVRAVNRILSEHHAGDLGVEERLEDDADTRAVEEANTLA